MINRLDDVDFGGKVGDQRDGRPGSPLISVAVGFELRVTFPVLVGPSTQETNIS